jgi:hypothetical protein
MLGICDSEHDSFDASRRSFKVEANSRAQKSRNLRVDKSDKSQSKFIFFCKKMRFYSSARIKKSARLFCSVKKIDFFDERHSDKSKRELGRSSIGDAASRDEKTY